MPTITPNGLLHAAGLKPEGPLPWGTPITATWPGVYIVEWPTSIVTAPVHEPAIGRWLDKARDLQMDGARPTPADLASRIASFWVPHQTIVYIGQTSLHLGGRIRQYYETDLGDRRPHSGGMWLKALEGFERSLLWWAPSPDPFAAEMRLMQEFSAALPSQLPFANIEVWSRTGSSGLTRTRKLHGLTRQRTPR